jgi:cytochrome c-type biogenesis protein CcmE
MKGFYLRWAVVIGVALVLAWLAAQHYDREVRAVTPEQLLEARSEGTVRVIGMVQAGSLTIVPQEASAATPPLTPPTTPSSTPPMILAEFELAGQQAHLLVHYDGPADDNLRELKTLVVVGHLNAPGAAGSAGLDKQRFDAHALDLLPNYGFITAAYLLALIPLVLFLFGMERRVAILYTVIKETTAYQPEAER